MPTNPKPRGRRPSKREKVLAVATALLKQYGLLQGFSLDLVAEKAGMSKGGVLYSFPSKEDLLLAIALREQESQIEAGGVVIVPPNRYMAEVALILATYALAKDAYFRQPIERKSDGTPRNLGN